MKCPKCDRDSMDAGCLPHAAEFAAEAIVAFEKAFWKSVEKAPARKEKR